MKQVYIFFTITTFFFNQTCFSQTGNDIEQDFLNMRKSVIGIGVVVNDSIIVNDKKVVSRRFVPVGSGLITYARYDTTLLTNIVTAGHVIKFFTENKIKSIFLRPSWADTIRTTEYFGVEVPLTNADNTPNTFLYPDNHVDLGCILMPSGYYNTVYIQKLIKDGNRMFPYNSMTTPFLGDQVWIGGYPGNIQNEMESHFLYSIATFKPGYIAWKPSSNMSNSDLSHITLVESNATYGNSGGPVFSLHDKIELVGILVGGYEDVDTVYLNNKPVIDPLTKQALVAKSRAGVSIIEKAEFVKKLVEFVQTELDKYRDATLK